MKRSTGLSIAGLLAAVLIPFVLAGCDGGSGGSSGGSPAAGLNVTGFWEYPLNGQTAAGTVVQTNGNVTGLLLLPPKPNGSLTGTLNGYHMTFTMAYDDGTTESGQGDFSFVTSSTDVLLLNASTPSLGNFTLSWRGPDVADHNPAGETLTYTPSP